MLWNGCEYTLTTTSSKVYPTQFRLAKTPARRFWFLLIFVIINAGIAVGPVFRWFPLVAVRRALIQTNRIGGHL